MNGSDDTMRRCTGYRAEQDRKMREMVATIQRQAERIKELDAELAKRKE